MSARSTAARLLRRGLKPVAAAADVVRRPAPGITVLIYHRVGGRSASEIDLPVERFEEQMAELAATRTVVDLDAALAALAGPPPDGPSPVVVTFDDGTDDFADLAVPVLVRHRVPATLYVATRFVDEGLAFPADGRPVSWSGLRDAASTGFVSVGSHTHSHALLDRLPVDLVDDELDRSIELIGEHVGVDARHFAYPKAVAPSPQAAEAVRRRFASAALGGSRANPYGRTDPQRLARTAIQVSDGMRWFRRKAAGGLAFEDGARRALNRLRYARAES